MEVTDLRYSDADPPPRKMERLRQWCEDLNRVQSHVIYDFVYVDQESFDHYHPTSFRQLADAFTDYKPKT